MREVKSEFYVEVEKFVSVYPSLVEEAKKNLNGMFNSLEYPSQEKIKEKFYFNVDIEPIPCGKDFRVSLSKEEMEKIKIETDNRVKEAEQLAIKNLWQRLAEPIRHIAEKLKEKDSIFRNSMIENLNDVLNIIPDLNLTEDKELENIVKECREKLTIFSPQDLREQKNARKSTLQSAEEILKRMEGYV